MSNHKRRDLFTAAALTGILSNPNQTARITLEAPALNLTPHEAIAHTATVIGQQCAELADELDRQELKKELATDFIPHEQQTTHEQVQ